MCNGEHIRKIFVLPAGIPFPTISFEGKLKVKLSLCLTKYDAIKTYWGMKV
jgi:hypothetical protein